MRRAGAPWAIIGLALGVRLILVALASPHPDRFYLEPDSSGYERLALSLLLDPGLLALAYTGLVAGPEVYPRFRVPLMPAVAWLAGVGLGLLHARARPGHA